MTDVCNPAGVSVYWNPRRALLTVLFLLSIGIAALSCSAVREETQKCNGMFWRFVVYNIKPELYAKKCGCPNSLDFRFSCNSQYLGILH